MSNNFENNENVEAQYLADKDNNNYPLSNSLFNKVKDELRNMKPVYDCRFDYDVDTSLRGKQLGEDLKKIFDRHDNVAYDKLFGDIVLNKASVKNDVGHYTSNLKAYAMTPTIGNGAVIQITSKDVSHKMQLCF